MKKQKLNQYFATILVRIGEYETHCHYTLSAFDRQSAMRQVNEAYGIGEDDIYGERIFEIYDIAEVSDEEMAVLRKYI
jgi:hypothetical protein